MALTGPPLDPLSEVLAAVDRVADAYDETVEYLRPQKGLRLSAELEILFACRDRWKKSGLGYTVGQSAPTP